MEPEKIRELNTRLLEIFIDNHFRWDYWDGDTIKANLSDVVKALEIYGYKQEAETRKQVEGFLGMCWFYESCNTCGAKGNHRCTEYIANGMCPAWLAMKGDGLPMNETGSVQKQDIQSLENAIKRIERQLDKIIEVLIASQQGE